MKITYFVNAMVMLESASSRLLCDPWVTFDGRSTSGFYNFPEAPFTREEIAALEPDFIYITHTHPDHFDPATLELFAKDTPVLVSWYKFNFTEKAVANLGFTDVRVSDPQGGIALNGEDRCWLSPGTAYPDVDSIAVFRLDGALAFNANDNPFVAEPIDAVRERFGPFDVALLPFAGHGPYPMFYENLSEAEKVTLAEQKKNKYYNDFEKYIEALEPRVVAPIAGGLMAGGEKARCYVHSGLGRATEALERAARRFEFEPVPLSAWNSYDTETSERSGAYVERTHASEADYVERLAGTPGLFDAGGAFHIAPSERIDLCNLLSLAKQKFDKWAAIKALDTRTVCFLDVGEATLYRIATDSQEVTRVARDAVADPRYEIFRLPYGLLVGLLTGHYKWSNVKTQHVMYFREPDQFDAALHQLMNHLHL